MERCHIILMMNELMILTILSIENEEDRKFAETLYEKYYPLVKNTIYKVLKENSDEIDDLVQNVFVKLINKIDLIQSFEEAVLISYIIVVSKNVAINFIKNRSKKSERTFFGEEDDVMDSIIDDNKTPEELFIINAEQENLYKVLKQLPEKYRLFLQYKYFSNMSDKSIADIFNIGANSVKVYISRARKMAYELLKESRIDDNEPK